MKAIEIKLPATLQDCTPDMMSKWLMVAPVYQEAAEDMMTSLDFQCQLISIFSGLSVSKVRKAHIDDVLSCSKHILTILGTYVQKEKPTGKVVIDGVTYLFEPDISVMSTGQIIDLKLIESVQEDPCGALAICYIEEGMEYAQEDDRGKVLNPSVKRKEIFKKAFPGDEFIDFFAFFFAAIRAAEARYLGDPDNQDEGADEDTEEDHSSSDERNDSEWFIWTGLLVHLANELQKDVDEITRQPYIKTLFWLNYFKLKSEQDYILSKHGRT
jgi:hypothetical protein